eukprot:scaffold22190_cov37-Tisochrysis_lutea.AAC.1
MYRLAAVAVGIRLRVWRIRPPFRAEAARVVPVCESVVGAYASVGDMFIIVELSAFLCTGRRLQWIKHPELPLKNASEEGSHLGLGLLDWDNHVKALQAKWILNYLLPR